MIGLNFAKNISGENTLQRGLPHVAQKDAFYTAYIPSMGFQQKWRFTTSMARYFLALPKKTLTSLHLADPNIKTVIIDMHDVPSMDGTAIVALQSLIAEMKHEDVKLVIVGIKQVSFQP